MWKCSKYSTCKITKNRLTCNISVNIINFFNHIKLFLSFKFCKIHKNKIYKGDSGTQPLKRTEHSLSEICLKNKLYSKIGNHAKNRSWLPFAKSLFVHHPNAMVFCLTIISFLIQWEWGTHSVLMRRSFSIDAALIQYLLEGSR